MEAIVVDTRSGALSKDAARRLLDAYAQNQDVDARNQLVAAHQPLARWAAAKFANRGEPVDDLEQVALMGLLKAIERYDPEQGAAFSTYAVATMLGELRRYLRDHAWKVHLPRSLHDRHHQVLKTIDLLTAELGRSPTLTEVSRRSGTTVEQVVEAMEVGSRGRPASLEEQTEGDGLDRQVSLADAHAGITRVEERADVAALLGRLSPRAQLVVQMRFLLDMTQEEIGQRLGVSQMQISRILSQSLDRLRAWASEGTVATA